MPPDTDDQSTYDASSPSASGLSLTNRLLVAQDVARLIRARLPLTQALKSVSGQAQGSLAQAIDHVIARLEQGQSLTHSLAQGSDRSARTLAASIELGQLCGAIDAAIEHWVTWQLTEQRYRQRLFGALVYPALLIGIALASLLFSAWRLIPRYEEAFIQLAQIHPRWLDILSTIHRNYGVFASALLATVAGVCWWSLRRRRGVDRHGFPRNPASRQLFYSRTASLSLLGVRSGRPVSSWLELVTSGAGLTHAQGQLEANEYWSHRLGKETSSVLNALTAGSLQTDSAESLLKSISHNLAELSEVTVTRQVHWLPIYTSAGVGLLTVLAYVTLIYLPWLALFFEIAKDS